MTSRIIGPGVRPQPIDGSRPERSANSPEPRAKGSAWNRIKTDFQIRLVKGAYRDLRIRSAGKGAVESTGLDGLAGGKLSGNLGTKIVLEQLIECQNCDWQKQIGKMSDARLLQTYKNVKHNSAVLSAIEQTHGNPSALYDFARRIADALTQAVRNKGMRADDIVPKPFDRVAEKNEELVGILGRELFRPLARGEVGALVVLKQLLRHNASDDSWMQSLSLLDDREILQIRDNIRNSRGAILSIVGKSLGNQHPIHGFVMLFEALIEVEVERRGLPKDSREPAQISVNTHEMIKALLPYGGTVPALGEEAKKLPTLGQTTMLQMDRLLEFLEHHLTTCASEDFWKQQPASSQYPFFGLSINIAHLRTLNARIASGGRIINEDLMTLENLLRDALGVRNTELAKMISRIDTKNEPKTVLNQMAGVVSHYYFGKRQLFDGGTNEYYEGRLINLNRNPEKILSALRTAGDAGELIGALEQALSESIAGTDFKKPLIVQQFADTAKAMAEPDQPLIFHP